jgi:plasmid stabilization system protein ParE
VVYEVRRAADVTRDLGLIEDHLFQTYRGFGEDVAEAVAKAIARVEDAQAYIRTFAGHPHRGTEHPSIRPGLRTVTNNRFIYYFEIDDSALEVTILAVFFGGIDHQQQILERLRH